MFSKENRRFTLLILAGVFVFAYTVSGLVRIIDNGNAKDATILTLFAGAIVGQLWLMAKQEQNRRESKTDRQEIKSDLKDVKDTLESAKGTDPAGVAKVIRVAATQVAEAKQEVPPFLENRLHQFAKEICDRFVEEHKVDAEAVAEETVQRARREVEAAARNTVKVVLEELEKAGKLR
jgi:hypothetical protein